MDAVEWQADAWQVLSTSNEQLGNTDAALRAYKNHIQFRDSVLGEEKKAALIRKEMQFKLEKQETEANAEIKQQRLIKNGAIIGGIALIVDFYCWVCFFTKDVRDGLGSKKDCGIPCQSSGNGIEGFTIANESTLYF